jgi:hypothetical protein
MCSGRRRKRIVSEGAVPHQAREPAYRARRVMSLEDFTDADIAALEAARAPEAAKAFDDELNPP